MRKFKVVIETGSVDGMYIETFEMADDATEEEIADEAREIFFNQCTYGCHEITGEDDGNEAPHQIR
jgi:hypothetical protein